MPQAELWPRYWSASFIETLLTCPYRALGERVLKLAPPDPLSPQPDPREAGLLVHRWLERIGRSQPDTSLPQAQMVAHMLALATEELNRESPLVRAIWRGKFAKLAPALAAQWQADGRTLSAVEQRLRHSVGPVTVTATLDRVETTADGRKVILDFKTGTPPSWSHVASGEKPQLALEAWLLGEDTGGLEYWHLKGYGSAPLSISRAGDGQRQKLEPLLEPVADGVARLVETFGEGAAFAALPDMRGGGLQATGACTYCALGGVCRRKTSVEALSAASTDRKAKEETRHVQL